ncbi:hypothetical protein [Streptomyces sp. TRM68367]|uniref:hypothetical protein n=1 Tax=Streptomyces sp. TRM68367 TaxID=2758415 RepID=UPI00165A14D5|nr:hypothetical protein [Streptomyces sp. TRM68367]MBC9723674.1 hypothetical protein [Streptomyces sp. TRM68367]
MTVLMVAAAIYGMLQLFTLSWPTRSVRLSTTLLLMLVGAYAGTTAAALLELTYTRTIAHTTGQSLTDVVNTTSYQTAPWVEELANVGIGRPETVGLVLGANADGGLARSYGCRSGGSRPASSTGIGAGA